MGQLYFYKDMKHLKEHSRISGVELLFRIFQKLFNFYP